jgi:hypothetical protein
MLVYPVERGTGIFARVVDGAGGVEVTFLKQTGRGFGPGNRAPLDRVICHQTFELPYHHVVDRVYAVLQNLKPGDPIC